MNAIANATPAMSAGKYMNVFGLTMPLNFHEVGQMPNNAALYPPRICPTDKDVTSIFEAEYPFSHSPTQALNIAVESLVVLFTWNIRAKSCKNELAMRIPRITTASIAIAPKSARKNFPTIVDTFRLFAIMFFTSPTIVKIQVSPTAVIKIHQNTAPIVESPTINSMMFTCCP